MKPVAPESLAAINTSLIVVSGLLLLLGYYFIRRRQIARHRATMIAAATFAAFFLVVYVTRSVLYAPKVFAGTGTARLIYLGILISHTLMAIAVGPLAIVTLRRALRSEWVLHRQIARVTLPIWLYVVVTGWTVFYLLRTLA